MNSYFLKNYGFGLIVAALILIPTAGKSAETQNRIDPDGTIRIPAFTLPSSGYESEEATRNLIDFVRAFELVKSLQSKDIKEFRRVLDDKLMRPGVERLRAVFSVKISPLTIGGVPTDVVEPEDGISPNNKNRVLINLHGGGFQVGGGLGGQMESIPIASLGRIKVITVDYREGPEYRFPAASEDVASVYREILKQYPAKNIGIYGCSAGGSLTAESVAWFQAHQLPRPGAIGIFGYGAVIGTAGDSSFVAEAMMALPVPTVQHVNDESPYFAGPGINFSDPLISPARSPAVLKLFPPTLMLSGTRDLGLSNVAYAHAQLIKAGVESDLHIWEGVPHCSFAQPVVDPHEPESREAWDVAIKFFEKHLGSRQDKPVKRGGG